MAVDKTDIEEAGKNDDERKQMMEDQNQDEEGRTMNDPDAVQLCKGEPAPG
jgi:hypothetical protein